MPLREECMASPYYPQILRMFIKKEQEAGRLSTNPSRPATRSNQRPGYCAPSFRIYGYLFATVIASWISKRSIVSGERVGLVLPISTNVVEYRLNHFSYRY